MQIEKHDKSYIVKLEDGSSWSEFGQVILL